MSFASKEGEPAYGEHSWSATRPKNAFQLGIATRNGHAEPSWQLLMGETKYGA